VTTVLDTSVVSALMRHEAPALSRLQALRPSEVLLVSPVAAEIAFGLERLARRTRRRRLLDREYAKLRSIVRWQDWNETASRTFGQIKARLERKGEIIEDMDIAIASVALDLGADLATLNSKHFARVAGLSVKDWSR
jgi:tRNA(fMet)-specific endonuclease VapC